MDELQDWLADARYSQSLMEGSHKPMKQIPLPPNQKIPDSFINNLAWSCEAILSQPVGRYFLGRFIAEEQPNKLWLHQFHVTCCEIEEDDTNDLLGCLSKLDTFIKQEQQHVKYPIQYQSLQNELTRLSTSFSSTSSFVYSNAASAASITSVNKMNIDAREIQEKQNRRQALEAIQPLRLVMSTLYNSTATSLVSLFLRTGITITLPPSVLLSFNGVESEAESIQSSSTMAMSISSSSEEKQQQQHQQHQQQQQQQQNIYKDGRSSNLLVFNTAEPLELLPNDKDAKDTNQNNNNKKQKKKSNSQKLRTGRYMVPEQRPIDSSNSSPENETNEYAIPWLDKYVETLWWSQRPMSVDDMAVFRDIGRGAFGIVSGVTCVYTGKMFALKAMDRKLIKGKNASSLVMQEYEILRVLIEKPSKFVVALHYSFADMDSIYLCLNLLTGGDLRFHLSKVGKFNEKCVQFFIAQISLGLSHLHQLGILYRDLKPENIMLDEKGKYIYIYAHA